MATSEKLVKVQGTHEDVQNRPDSRNIPINKVGICDLKMPMVLKGCEKDENSSQHVQAILALSVDLDSSKKGIHMSRLVETVLDHSKEISLNTINGFLDDLCSRQVARNAYVRIDFDYFISKVAPVSGLTAPQAYSCSYEVAYGEYGYVIKQSVEVPVKTLCPCSKEISDYGAHNQRSKIWITLVHKLEVDKKIGISLEDIVEIAENGASSPLYPILKREDERHVTMSAYDKPCFVEDVVRNIATELNNDNRFCSYEIKVVNYESIHSHNAFAVIKGDNNNNISNYLNLLDIVL
ncbi:MAG: GTP cyclohydrolase FolE2 [Thermodesulfobacteriota bacterium]